MLVILACANGLRTIAMCSIPGSWMLSVHRVRPVISRWSSLRRRERPISFAGRSVGAVLGDGHARHPLARRCDGAGRRCCTARTMLW